MSEISVEVKVIGMFEAAFVAVARKVSLPAGARARDALRALHEAGGIDGEVLAVAIELAPPLFLVINDQPAGARGLATQLADGDVVSVLQLSAGG